MKQKKQPRKVSKVISNVLAAITGVFVVALLGLQIYGQAMARQNRGIPLYGDKMVMIVLSDSMEPTYNVGTALFVEQVNDFSKLKASTSIDAFDGDVITFYNPLLSFDVKWVTHRIVEIEVDANGNRTFYTLGDNYENAKVCVRDEVGACRVDVVRENDVLGKVIGQSPAFGKVYGVMSNNIFILLFAIIPLFFVFSTSIIDLFKQLRTTNGEVKVRQSKASEKEVMFELEKLKEKEKLKMYIEIEKEQLRKEMAEERGEEDGEE